MRTQDLGHGIAVTSPYLSIEEAAVYCNMSRTAFIKGTSRDGVAYRARGNDNSPQRIYDAADLDRWMNLKKVTP